MGISAEIDAQIERIKAAIPEYNKNALAALSKRVNATMPDVYREFGKYQRMMIERVFIEAVNTFYDSYPQRKYDPRGSLYNVLDMKTDARGVVVYDDYIDLFNPMSIGPDRKGTNSLFGTVFLAGFHGGAMTITKDADVWGEHPDPGGVSKVVGVDVVVTGSAYYRTSGYVTYKNGVRKHHRYGKWGKKAVRTTSAYTMTATGLSLLERSAMKDELKKISRKYGEKASDDFKRIDKPALVKRFFGV